MSNESTFWERARDWPLVFTVEDVFCPEVAGVVLQVMKGIDEETLAVAWACHGYAAWQDVELRKN